LNDHEINEPCAVRKWFNLSHREGSVENVENIYHSMLFICDMYTISVIVGASTNVYYYLFLFENQNVFIRHTDKIIRHTRRLKEEQTK
jgi:hypothetical protein